MFIVKPSLSGYFFARVASFTSVTVLVPLKDYFSPSVATPSRFCLHTRASNEYKGVRKGRVLGLKHPLEHDILQNFITYAKEINCFRILFAC